MSIDKMFEAIKRPRKRQQRKYVEYHINVYEDGSFDFNCRDNDPRYNISLENFGAYEGDTYIVSERNGGVHFRLAKT